MARKLAVKRLSAVEIDSAQSHQHEFHAGRLRAGLGFGDDKQSGELRLDIHQRDGTIVSDAAPYTLYDARILNPKRSEWHLYYASKELSTKASPGDLLVLFRPDDESTDVQGLILSPGSEAEQRILPLLDLGRDFDLESFQLVEPKAPSGDDASQLLLALSEVEPPSAQEVFAPTDHPLLMRAIEDDKAPTSAEMAAAAADLSAVAISDADGYLIDVLGVETSLYFAIETAIQTKRLRVLIKEGGAVPEVLDWAMRIHQARKSRRGQSLQLHFARILTTRRIPHSPQCLTEEGETPDFVFPSCAAYHDPGFRVDGLRMVACKSTSKERWRQVLNEARRIEVKYLLTLDTALTAATIDQMLAAGLEPHLPADVIRSSYGANSERDRLGTVARLLDKLEAAIL